jgi:hypothetical protein
MKNRRKIILSKVYRILTMIVALQMFGEAQQLYVVLVSPSFNEITSDKRPQIITVFNESVDVSTLNLINFAVLGERSGYKNGTISYDSTQKKAIFLSSNDFIAGERVTVSLARGIHSSTGDSLSGFTWEFRIPSKPVGLNFYKPVYYNGSGYGMQCVDMNNDGSPDIITSSGTVLLNSGSGQFNSSWVLPDADGFGDIIIDDFNRDGFGDVLYTGSGGLKIGLGNGEGNFTISTNQYWFFNYAVADFNGDGFQDIAGINRLYGLNPPNSDTASYWGVSINSGTGNFSDTTIMGIYGGWFRGITTTDIDNDGDLDVVIISQHAVASDIYGFEGIIVSKNNGQGNFKQVEFYPVGEYFDISQPEFICPADYNNDGFTDIAVMGAFSGTILLNSGNGSYINDSTHVRAFWGAEQISPITSGDINGDGWIDIGKSGYTIPFELYPRFYAVRINCNSNFLYNCNSQNIYVDTLPNAFIYSVAAVDLDSDGDMDLVHAGEGVFISLNGDTITSVNYGFEQPKDYSLSQNYPNPFNPSTTIRYAVPFTSRIKLSIFNLLGQQVGKAVNEMKDAGFYEYYFDASQISSGIYFYRIEAVSEQNPSNLYINTKKMVLMR